MLGARYVRCHPDAPASSAAVAHRGRWGSEESGAETEAHLARGPADVLGLFCVVD